MTVRLRPATTYLAVVGRVLSRFRARSDKRQADVAAALGVSQSVLSKLERGATPLTVEMLAEIARVFGTRPGRILDAVERVVEWLRKHGVDVSTRDDGDDADGERIAVEPSALDTLVDAVLDEGS